MESTRKTRLASACIAFLGLVCLVWWGAAAEARPKEAVPDELTPGRDRPWIDTGSLVASSVARPARLTGTVWYEDQRALGRQRDRLDLDGRPGRSRRARNDRRQDFLGAVFMQVDVFEHDAGLALGRGCRRLEFIGRTTVQLDGSFSVPVPVHDACQSESADPPRYRIQVSTQYCEGEVCVAVGKRPGAAYALWYGLDEPLMVGAADGRQNRLLFRPERTRPPSIEAMAGNHFASLIDAVRVIHIQGGVPFRLDPYGPLHVRFPSIWSSGRATSASLVDASNEGWPKGNLMLHEYGHIVHRRAWDGDYAGFPDPIQAWNPVRHSPEQPFIALKEGWAIFVSNYVLGRCDRPQYDTRDDLHSVGRERSGIHFPQNHHYLLCDLVDEQSDRPGASIDDTVHLSLYALWSLLDQVDDRLDEYPHHDPVREGLDACDLMQTYLLAADESDSRTSQRALIEAYSLLFINDIWCPDIVDRYASLPVVSEPSKVAPAAIPAVNAERPEAESGP
ncbi:MAG TPA: hypothetical protein DFR83_18605 [Deltaproteobacteria bacterium]|nr:hypothetical protein [Deltaproteobacteria bacterium]